MKNNKDVDSLSHTTWRCQYHVVFAPKYRRMVIYGQIKKDIGQISLVQFHDCSVHYTGTWKMCKKCSAYSSNMKAVFHSGAL